MHLSGCPIEQSGTSERDVVNQNRPIPRDGSFCQSNGKRDSKMAVRTFLGLSDLRKIEAFCHEVIPFEAQLSCEGRQ
jgi:hypothetical protein